MRASWAAAATIGAGAEVTDTCDAQAAIKEPKSDNTLESDGIPLKAIVGVVALLVMCIGLLCGCLIAMCCFPPAKVAIEDRRIEVSSQTEEFDIPPYWEMLADDLRKELQLRGRAPPRLKRECVGALLELDMRRLVRPPEWRQVSRLEAR